MTAVQRDSIEDPVAGLIVYCNNCGTSGEMQYFNGLIAASTDQSAGIEWYNGTFVRTYAQSQAIGSGNQNTTTIINVQGAGSYAAKLCADLVSEGYSDWYLPSFTELQKLVGANGAGMVNGGDYWTSSEATGPDELQKAWSIHFLIGDYAASDKSLLLRVRAIRSF